MQHTIKKALTITSNEITPKNANTILNGFRTLNFKCFNKLNAPTEQIIHKTFIKSITMYVSAFPNIIVRLLFYEIQRNTPAPTQTNLRGTLL